MKTYNIELPSEFLSGNSVPVTVATIKRERMEEILIAAIEADRQTRVCECKRMTAAVINVESEL